MNGLLDRLFSLRRRHFAALCVFSLLICMGLAVANLAMAARTEALNRELSRLYERNTQLSQETNETWTTIGRVASIDEMERRARQAGFGPTEKFEYLQPIPVTSTPPVPPTLIPRLP